MGQFLIILLFLSVGFLNGSISAIAANRVALVIGNSAYQHTRVLRNPGPDAKAIAETFKKIGFDVSLKRDLTYKQLRNALRVFGRKARSAEMAVVYYAGHGMELGKHNWLVPVDARIKRDDEVEDEAVSLSYVLRKVQGASKLKLVILDACRNNPLASKMAMSSGLTRSVTRGLGRIEPESDGVLVAYAAKHGTRALDGDGRHSPYAAALLKHMATPGLDVRLMFGKVRDDVRKVTGKQQEPFIYGSLGGQPVMLVKGNKLASLPPAQSAESKLWARIENGGRLSDLQFYLREYPKGQYAPLARFRKQEILRGLKGWKLTPQVGHSSVVMSVSFSPDGQFIASGGSDGTVKLWEKETGLLLRTMTGHSFWAPVGFSPDGLLIVSSGSEGTVKLWDSATGRLLRTMTAPRSENIVDLVETIVSVSFSHNGQHIVSGDRFGKVRLWEAATGKLLRTMEGQDHSEVRVVGFSPDDRRIISGGEDKTIEIWDTASGKLLRTLKGHSETVFSVEFSPNGRFIVSGGLDDTVKLWDAQTGELKYSLTGHVKPVSSVSFSPDAKSIISGSMDKTIKVWDAASGRLQRTLTGHARGVASVKFSPDGIQLISGSYDKTVKLWNASTGELQRTLTGHLKWVSSVVFSPVGELLAWGSSDHTVILFDTSTGSPQLRRLIGHTDGVSSVVFSPDGKRLVSGSFDKTMKLWDVRTGQLLRTFTRRIGKVNSVAFSPDGHSVASVESYRDNKGHSWQVNLWNAQRGKLLRTFLGSREDGYITNEDSLVFSRNGQHISLHSIGNVRIAWDVTSGQRTVISSDTEIDMKTELRIWSGGNSTKSASGNERAEAVGSEVNIIKAKTGVRAFTISNLPGSEWMIYGHGRNNGRYVSSPGAHKYLRLVKGYEVKPVPEDYKAAFFDSDVK